MVSESALRRRFDANFSAPYPIARETAYSSIAANAGIEETYANSQFGTARPFRSIRLRTKEILKQPSRHTVAESTPL